MKNFTFAFLSIFCISSCIKERVSQSPDVPSSLKNVDFPRSMHADYTTGKLTIVYESGKKIVKDIPPPKTSSGTRITEQGQEITDLTIVEQIEIPDL